MSHVTHASMSHGAHSNAVRCTALICATWFIDICVTWLIALLVGACVESDFTANSYAVRSGEDSQDPLSCRSFSTKEPLNTGQFCGKWPVKIRDPMSLRHPVRCTALLCAPWLIDVCVTWLMRRDSLTYVWRDSLICLTWRINSTMSNKSMSHVTRISMSHVAQVKHINESCHTLIVWCIALLYPKWLIDICVTWLVDMCDETYWYVWRDSLICVTWLIAICDVTHWCMWLDSLVGACVESYLTAKLCCQQQGCKVTPFKLWCSMSQCVAVCCSVLQCVARCPPLSWYQSAITHTRTHAHTSVHTHAHTHNSHMHTTCARTQHTQTHEGTCMRTRARAYTCIHTHTHTHLYTHTRAHTHTHTHARTHTHTRTHTYTHTHIHTRTHAVRALVHTFMHASTCADQKQSVCYRYDHLALSLCYSVLQRVVVCCSVLQCVAVCCSVVYASNTHVPLCYIVLQRVAACYSVLPRGATWCRLPIHNSQCAVVCCSVVQCVAVCCSVLQCGAVWCSVVQCGVVCCILA